jgi:hypothetical protein
MDNDPIGVASGRERGAPDIDVISAVERIGNDLQVTVGRTLLSRHGDVGRIFEKATVRLTVDDLDRLINTLTLARTAL